MVAPTVTPDAASMMQARQMVTIFVIIFFALIDPGAAGAGAVPAVVAVPAPSSDLTMSRGPDVRYALPFPGEPTVVRPFAPPPTPYAAGHRGVDFATADHSTVTAAAAGVVTFSGVLAERGVLVVEHPDGVSTEYEPVDASVQRGDAVARGQVIGQVAGTHGECAPDSCLHWGPAAMAATSTR
jgi:murein DD-endopeptidase MepM/ murein hydrolase activator NlpD